METIVVNPQHSDQWIPVVGEETLALLRHKGFNDANNHISEDGLMIQSSAVSIMESCGNPAIERNNETGLVIGYVQSGKTLSFTTVAALAKDNDYQIVIVIAGTSIPLFTQSTNRIKKDLRIDDRTDRKWVVMTNPKTVEDRGSIDSIMRQWADQSYLRGRCKTVLITVMKHGQHLNNLTTLLNQINLFHVPVLIIDDEGDQASMNTRARAAARSNIRISESEWSTIYRRINELRNVLPHHTYLQYTATPQAPLFINIMDRLSPNFIKLLIPGSDYTGGFTFFQQNPNLVRAIPLGDISTPGVSLSEPPRTLKEALMIFFLGVAAGEHEGSHGNRSMMVHPSRLQGDHAQYYGFVNNIVGSWRRLITSDLADDIEDRDNLLSEFRNVYRDLQVTVDNLPSFQDLSENHLRHAIEYTPIIEVNSSRGKTPQIAWQNEYAFILVGGQAMDRGFTVEGLTVTYMPRGIGTANVDTVQQRARFFGYKRKYIGYCRVYLDQTTIDSYEAIVEHEENIRTSLNEFNVNSRPLNNWDRTAVLDTMLNLTRNNILYDELERSSFGAEWFNIKAPHDSEQYIASNRQILAEFISAHAADFSLYQGHTLRTLEQKHLLAKISLNECFEELLNKIKYTRERDSALFTSFKSVIKMYLGANGDEICNIYLMSTQSVRFDEWQPRLRRLSNKDEILNLFQGKNPRTGTVIYPGDSEIKESDVLTIQIHLLNLRDTLYQQVPTVAIWVPERMEQSIISQIPTTTS